ncbi:MAG: type IV pili methyl-accepting chemotaxis transducer N-terminal domain-containing protein [Candidatus Hydrogenedentes bacterium]|nr:type IV pili methyl-accepting chemotaxis transducer N-terminal domain-containing protein [Candidatus Hydrogenedentota bacterium]
MSAVRLLPDPSRRLTVLYIGALSTVALLTILGQVLVQFMLHRQETDSRVINVAGRQRMLSQRLAKTALQAAAAVEPASRAAHLAELVEVAALWEASHVGLRHGDTVLLLPGSNSPRVQALFAVLEQPYRAMRDAAASLASTLDAGGDAAEAPWIAQIAGNERAFLMGMDAVVSAYEEEARARVRRLSGMELALMFSTLTILILEGIVIFRPAAEHIRGAFARQAASEAQSTRLAGELQTILDSAPALIWYQDREGALIRINSTASALIGKPPRALLSNPMARWFPDDMAAIRKEDKAVWQTGTPMLNAQYRMETATGGRRWLNVSKTPYCGEEGTPEGVIVIAEDITERVHLERRLRDLRLDEQRRVGHDLHDSLGQVLTGVTFLSRGLENRLKLAAPLEAERAAEIGALVRNAVKQVRAMAQGIRPIEPGPEGLVRGLEALAAQTTALGRVSCSFESGSMPVHLDDDVAEQLYRIAQEAVGNALRHSGSPAVHIAMSADRGPLRLSIEDWGTGIPPMLFTEGTGSIEEGRGLGLRIMQHRAQLAAGRLRIYPQSPQGTVVECEVRLEEKPERARTEEQ